MKTKTNIRRISNVCFVLLLLFTLTISPQQGVRAADLTAGTPTELSNAITTANDNEEADKITLTADITLTSTTLPTISSEITIEGAGYTLDSGGALALRVGTTGDLTLNEITISNASGGQGGGVHNEGSLMVSNSIFSNNDAEFGGGVYNAGTAIIANSEFYTNTASSGSRYGGGISNSGTLTVTNSTFSANDAIYGGGLYNIGTATIIDSQFNDNDADENGGGILSSANGILNITNSTFLRNEAFALGGSIYNTGNSILTLTGSTLTNNDASSGGGGIYSASTAFIISTSFYTNTTNGSGGGIRLENDALLTVTDSIFSANKAENYGGGIYNNNGTLTVEQTEFYTNTAKEDGGSDGSGGGIYTNNIASIANSTFHANSSNEPGGGINNTYILTVTNSTFYANTTALAFGSAINNNGSSVIVNSTFSSNESQQGGALQNGGEMKLINSTIYSTTQGSGIQSTNTLAIYNTIIAGNAGGDCYGTVNESSHNLIQDDASACGLTDGTDGNIIGQDPILGELADNGGNTLTHALPANSPAIDNADPTHCPATDQRGFPRPQDGNEDSTPVCDIGAYELAVSYSLTVTKTGNGSQNGIVTSIPAGINCGITCTADFISSITVTLVATTTTGATLDGWSGDCEGTEGDTCIVTMDAAKNVTANFILTANTLQVILAGTGSGTVTSIPAGIDCGTACSADFPPDTNVALNASPVTGSTFTGWSGACSGTGNCSITMNASQVVTATFEAGSNVYLPLVFKTANTH